MNATTLQYPGRLPPPRPLHNIIYIYIYMHCFVVFAPRRSNPLRAVLMHNADTAKACATGQVPEPGARA